MTTVAMVIGFVLYAICIGLIYAAYTTRKEYTREIAKLKATGKPNGSYKIIIKDDGETFIGIDLYPSSEEAIIDKNPIILERR